MSLEKRVAELERRLKRLEGVPALREYEIKQVAKQWHSETIHKHREAEAADGRKRRCGRGEGSN